MIKSSYLTVCLAFSYFFKPTRQIWPAHWESSNTQVYSLIQSFFPLDKWNMHRRDSAALSLESTGFTNSILLHKHTVLVRKAFFFPPFFIQDIMIFPKAWCLFTLSELAMLALLVSKAVPRNSSLIILMAVASPKPHRLSRVHSTTRSPREHSTASCKLPPVTSSPGWGYFCRTIGWAVCHCQHGDKWWPTEALRRM